MALINETMARQIWPGEDPIGRRFVIGRAGANPRWITVVGVVGDMHRGGVESSAGSQVFVPLRQMPSYGITLAIKTDLLPERILPATRHAIWAADKDAAIWGVKSVTELLEESLTDRRFQSVVLAVFGIAALALSIIGVFALAHRAVATRAQELGVRSALGASRSSLLSLVVWDGLRPAVVGEAFALVGSLAVASGFSAALYGVSGSDPLTFGAVGVGLAMAALLASLGAGWRATRTDPSTALRCS